MFEILIGVAVLALIAYIVHGPKGSGNNPKHTDSSRNKNRNINNHHGHQQNQNRGSMPGNNSYQISNARTHTSTKKKYNLPRAD